jgi:hypothetical protein
MIDERLEKFEAKTSSSADEVNGPDRLEERGSGRARGLGRGQHMEGYKVNGGTNNVTTYLTSS